MPRIEIDEHRCKGCGICTTVCPRTIIAMSDKINAMGHTPAICTSQESCIGCALCAEICPDVAILVYK